MDFFSIFVLAWLGDANEVVHRGEDVFIDDEVLLTTGYAHLNDARFFQAGNSPAYLHLVLTIFKILRFSVGFHVAIKTFYFRLLRLLFNPFLKTRGPLKSV